MKIFGINFEIKLNPKLESLGIYHVEIERILHFLETLYHSWLCSWIAMQACTSYLTSLGLVFSSVKEC